MSDPWARFRDLADEFAIDAENLEHLDRPRQAFDLAVAK